MRQKTGSPSADRAAAYFRCGRAVTAAARVTVLTAGISYGCLVAAATVPTVVGWNASVVTSGSMRPAFEPGDVVVSAPATIGQLTPGQIVIVDNPAHPGHLLMHRFERPGPADTIITRGDANAIEDSSPVPYSSLRGLPRLRVPYVGLPVLWLHTHAFLPLGALLVLISALAWTMTAAAGDDGAGSRGPRRRQRPTRLEAAGTNGPIGP